MAPRARGGRNRRAPRDRFPRRAGFRESCPAAGVEGTRQIDVFEWIDGHQLGSVESGVGERRGGRRRSILSRSVLLAARMHDQTSAWPPPPGFRRHSWDAAGLMGEPPLWGRFWELEALTRGERDYPLRGARCDCRGPRVSTAPGPTATVSSTPISCRRMCSSTAIGCA